MNISRDQVIRGLAVAKRGKDLFDGAKAFHTAYQSVRSAGEAVRDVNAATGIGRGVKVLGAAVLGVAFGSVFIKK